MFKIADLFTCPSCGSHRLEEVLTDVVESSEVTDLAGDQDDIYLEYGNTSTDGGQVDRYQCLDCGHVVARSVEEPRELFKSSLPTGETHGEN